MQPGQPPWQSSAAGSAVADAAAAGPPVSPFVRVTVTLDVEVVDEPAVREAARAALAQDLGRAPDAVHLVDLAACVMHLVRPIELLQGVPGVRPAGSGHSAGYRPAEPDRESGADGQRHRPR